MGDRYNVNIMQSTGDVLSFYSHNGFASGYFATVAVALENARSRWTDESYCTRIIVSSLLEEIYGEDGSGYETGSGIFVNQLTGVDHSQLLIDVNKRVVHLFPQQTYKVEEFRSDRIKMSWSFDKFADKY